MVKLACLLCNQERFLPLYKCKMRHTKVCHESSAHLLYSGASKLGNYERCSCQLGSAYFALCIRSDAALFMASLSLDNKPTYKVARVCSPPVSICDVVVTVPTCFRHVLLHLRMFPEHVNTWFRRRSESKCFLDVSAQARVSVTEFCNNNLIHGKHHLLRRVPLINIPDTPP